MPFLVDKTNFFGKFVNQNPVCKTTTKFYTKLGKEY